MSGKARGSVVTFVLCDGWTGMYVRGKKVAEYQLTPVCVAKALVGVRVARVDSFKADETWAYELPGLSLPDSLKDVVRAKGEQP